MNKLTIPIFFLLIALLFVSQLNAQKSERLINNWEFIKQDIGGVWEAVRPVGKGNPESVPLWQNVSLPHCVNAEDAVDPDLNYYQGPAWYRTQINIQNPYYKGRTLLHFEGAGQKTEVYIYTTKVGEHVGGYDEFTIDITDAVTAFRNSTAYQQQFKGKIPVSIRTDNSRNREMIPSNLSDFNVYGGIYRYLNLVYVPAVSIDKIFANASLDSLGKMGTVAVNLKISDPLKINTAKVSVKLISPGGIPVQRTENFFNNLKDAVNAASFTVKQPQLWSTDKPQLYTVEVSVINGENICTQTEKIGFRNFDFVKKGPFIFNGKRLLLKGTQRHEDHAGVAAAMTEETIRNEMIMIKEMGANFIRLGHYQQSRIVLNLCDSLGLLVWEEVPWCRGGLGGEAYQLQAKNMLTNMIEQHYNHPSVIIWGLGNENDWPGDFPTFEKDKIRSFMKELNTIAHQKDPSRKTAIRRCDFCSDIVDVYSPSIWAGWYRGIYTEYKDITQTEFNKVDRFIHIEWGGDSHAGRHSENPDNALQKIKTGNGADERAGDASLFGGAARVSKDGDWSESYIVNLFDWHLKEQETMPWLTGTAQWIFKDFSTPVRPDNPIPYMNQKGLVERDLTKKESYYVFQSYWATKPMAHIYGHTWPVRWGAEGEQKTVKVYSNCDEAELFLNNKSVGVKTRNSQDFPAAGLRWNVLFSKGNNILTVIAKKGKVIVRDTVLLQYQTEKWTKPAKLIVEKIKEENDTATVHVKLVDSQNLICLDAINFIRFGLTGDGKLIDNLGTVKASRYVQLTNGTAEIQVKTNKGKSVVSVQCDGIATVFLTL
jgi:beta-galactosidase